MTKYSFVALLGLLLGLQGLLNASAGRTSDYERPPARPLLPLEHKLLARPAGASPHVPEQVHLSLAGPGSMAVSWLTYPQTPDILDVSAVMTLQDDADNTGLLKRRRHLLESSDEEEYDVADDEDEDDDDSDDDEDMDRDEHRLKAGKDSESDSEAEEVDETAETTVEEGSILNRRGADSLAGVGVAQTGIDSNEADSNEDDEEVERLDKHKKKHKKHGHKKHKHKKKKHKKDRQQCRYLEGLTRSVVKFGTSSGDYLSVSHGNNTCYQADEYISGALHHVVLGTGPEGPLQPNTTYFYTCGDPDLGMSPEFSFSTPPVTGPESLPYRLGLIGDLGQTESSASTLDHLTASNPGSVINVGDLSYADGYQPRWDTWGRLIASHTSFFPWAVIEGNHEEEVTNGKTGFLAYETRFWFPSEESKSYSPFYYSYEVAGAHVLMLGSYVEYGTDSEQFAWLQQDLASVDRHRTPWVVVGMHAPWYNSNKAHQHEVDDMMEAMEGTLYQHGVDVVFAGHVHAYESSYPVFRGERDDCGPVHIVIGDGGNREGLADTYDEPQPEWSAYREASFGSGRLDLLNATHALWRWHRNQDSQAVVSDEIWLVRNSSCQAKGVAQPGLWQSEWTVAETTLQQSGEAVMALSRKFLRDAAGLFSAI